MRSPNEVETDAIDLPVESPMELTWLDRKSCVTEDCENSGDDGETFCVDGVWEIYDGRIRRIAEFIWSVKLLDSELMMGVLGIRVGVEGGCVVWLLESWAWLLSILWLSRTWLSEAVCVTGGISTTHDESWNHFPSVAQYTLETLVMNDEPDWTEKTSGFAARLIWGANKRERESKNEAGDSFVIHEKYLEDIWVNCDHILPLKGDEREERGGDNDKMKTIVKYF